MSLKTIAAEPSTAAPALDALFNFTAPEVPATGSAEAECPRRCDTASAAGKRSSGSPAPAASSRPSFDARAGQQQATVCADCLATQFGQAR